MFWVYELRQEGNIAHNYKKLPQDNCYTRATLLPVGNVEIFSYINETILSYRTIF